MGFTKWTWLAGVRSRIKVPHQSLQPGQQGAHAGFPRVDDGVDPGKAPQQADRRRDGRQQQQIGRRLTVLALLHRMGHNERRLPQVEHE